MLQVIRHGILYGRVCREGHILVNATQLCGIPFWSQYITHFPTGGMVGFTKTRYDKTPRCQFGIPRHTLVLQSIKNDMLVYLITNDDDIRIFHQLFQGEHILCRHNHPCGIVWSIDNNCPGFKVDELLYLGPVNGKASVFQLCEHGLPSVEFNSRHITIVGRFDYDYLIILPHNCRNRAKQA